MDLAHLVGIGRTKAGEHWNRGLVDLAVEAGGAALDEAAVSPTAIVVGNALGSVLGDQRNLAVYIAARLGYRQAETHTVESDEASGGAALRMALALLNAGFHEAVLVIGAEKPTDTFPDGVEAGRANGLDVLREAGFGFGVSVAAALAMTNYINTYGVDRSSFYHISAHAHRHAALNDLSFMSWALSEEQYAKSPLVADPFKVCDGAPPCDGAAAAVVTLKRPETDQTVRVIGSAGISIEPGIWRPVLELKLPAAQQSASRALDQAGLTTKAISLFELHDSSTIMGALSLEAIGLADKGQALKLAEGDALSLKGAHPAWTFGGHKARGHTLGASGMYQIVEAALQLRGDAGQNQVADARTALVQSLGSFGSTAFTHVLSR